MKHINVTLTDSDISELRSALLSEAWLSNDNSAQHHANVDCANHLAHKLLNTSLKSVKRDFFKEIDSALDNPLTWVDVYLPNGNCMDMRGFVNTRVNG